MANGRFILSVFGKAGSGKTFLVRKLIDHFPKPVLVLDTMDEFRGGVQFSGADDLRQFIVEGRPNVSGLYVLNATNDEDRDGFFRLITEGEIEGTIVLDEADLYCTPHQIDPSLFRSIKYGRHWGQNLVFCARRVAEVNRNVTAQSDAVVSFRQTEPRDIDTLRKIYQDAERLPDLSAEKYEFIVMGDTENLPFEETLLRLGSDNVKDGH